MTKKDAMNILNMSIFSQHILKQAYMKACSKYHPDRNPAGLEMMKAVNVAYHFLKELDIADESTETEGTGIDFGDAMNNAINAVINLDGVLIEICGNWIWLSGDTRPYKDTIKTAGYFWASKKMQWYFRPSDYKSNGRGRYSMDDIRARHGSESISHKTQCKSKLEERAA